ncbi:MmgE/PrpD family protein [soil metagenome]
MEELPQTVAEQLATFVVDTSYEELPDAVIHAARRCLLDFCGSALRGSIEPPARAARQTAAILHPGAGASRFPDGASLTPAGAAFVNGVSSHIVELDDLHNPSTFHPAAPIIPAVLAAAEVENASGKDVLRAIVLGYEVGIRIAEAVNPTHYRFWHPTGTCGTFGAAAGVAAILGLDVRQTADALGSAGTQASGLWAFIDEGAMSKHLHPGRAAENGLTAAYMARAGFTGAHRILESPRGFVAATTDGGAAEIALRKLGAPFAIVENGFKVHACCGHTHTAVDLAIECRERLQLNDIQRLRVGTYQAAVDVAGIETPSSAYEARFSLKFAVAVGVLDGAARITSFTDERVHDQRVMNLIERIDVAVDGEIDSRYPLEWGCRMEVEDARGELYVSQATHPRGMPANPLSDDELHEKYLTLASEAIDADDASRLAQRIWLLPEGNARLFVSELSTTMAVR